MTNNNSNILLIYTGGTIGMIKDPKTGVLFPFDFNNLLDSIPELKLLQCNIKTYSFDNPIDSSDMHPSYWLDIAKVIEDNYHDCDGFVVLHGSDTMSYTASALSFMLEHLAKPVIFTGSQLPIGDLRTDAKENLITAIQIASLQKDNKPVINEVGLYFEYKLYRANRTTKLNAEHFEAFTSFNYPELAESGVRLNINYDSLLAVAPDAKLVVHKKIESNIALVKLFPGISKPVLESVFNTKGLKAVVLETYGAGNCTTKKWFLELLEATIKKGVFVVNITQCLRGTVHMGQYETSEKLREIGLISGKDMTTEAALAKLMFLLGQNISANHLKTMYETVLRGEMSEN